MRRGGDVLEGSRLETRRASHEVVTFVLLVCRLTIVAKKLKREFKDMIST